MPASSLRVFSKLMRALLLLKVILTGMEQKGSELEGGGVSPFVSVFLGPASHKLDVLHTGEGILHQTQRFGGIFVLLRAEINGFAGEIN